MVLLSEDRFSHHDAGDAGRLDSICNTQVASSTACFGGGRWSVLALGRGTRATKPMPMENETAPRPLPLPTSPRRPSPGSSKVPRGYPPVNRAASPLLLSRQSLAGAGWNTLGTILSSQLPRLLGETDKSDSPWRSGLARDSRNLLTDILLRPKPPFRQDRHVLALELALHCFPPPGPAPAIMQERQRCERSRNVRGLMGSISSPLCTRANERTGLVREGDRSFVRGRRAHASPGPHAVSDHDRSGRILAHVRSLAVGR